MRRSIILTRRKFLVVSGSSLALVPAPSFATTQALMPEAFGARGDGTTNDSDAFAALSAEVNRRGGGEIALRPITYLVGRQMRGEHEGYSFAPEPIMHFLKCTAPLIIRGNGARLRSAPGLRYGTFDRETGRPTHHALPYTAPGELAAPYEAMLRAEECSGAVIIMGLELDGDLHSLELGGPYGDTGWQIPAVGLHLVNNRGSERLSDIHSHHHALDGILIDGPDGRIATSTLERVRSEYNGRQACSITGGSNYLFSDCRFANSGRGEISSAPGAGVDIEAEGGKRIRNLRFLRCTFSNNKGAGLVADSGDSASASFEMCTFIGTTNWAAWPNKPRFSFLKCTFVGAITHAFGDPDPQRACRFHDCRFLDDPALSPNRLVYGGANPSRPIADLPNNKNVLFDHCIFDLTHRSVLPWTTNVTIYDNCTMSQRAPAKSYPRGTFIGLNRISGNVDLYSSRIEGELILNGRSVH